MKRQLLNFDVFPKVIPVGKPVTITVRAKSKKSNFVSGKDYKVSILVMTEGNRKAYPNRNNYTEYTMQLSDDGCFHIPHTFTKESEHYIRIGDEKDWRITEVSVYAVEQDLVGRYPYIGDMHLHSTRSDGRDDPCIVAANYRKSGYDFMALTDHKRYYPSLEIDEFYKDMHLDFKMYPGEEVQLPDNDVHIINFGGDYSVNGIWNESMQCLDKGTDARWRSKYGKCPPCISYEDYCKEVNAVADRLHLPDTIEKFEYASCVWAFDHIRRGGGLAILAHPYWINDVYQVPDEFLNYMMEHRPFDAFEVAGGEIYYQQNGMQIAKYHEMAAKGYKMPVVGSTDSHESNDHNPGWRVARSIVLAPSNTRDALRDAVKDYYNVAIQEISGKVEMIGDFRMIRYCWFLLEEYFPLHDELCYEEGRLMREFACGDEEAGEELKRMEGRMDKFRKKYIQFD